MALAVEICNFEINIYHNHLFEKAKTQDMGGIYSLQQILAFADQQITPFADQQLEDGRTGID